MRIIAFHDENIFNIQFTLVFISVADEIVFANQIDNNWLKLYDS